MIKDFVLFLQYTMPAERERDTDRSALAGDPGALSDTLGLERATEDHR